MTTSNAVLRIAALVGIAAVLTIPATALAISQQGQVMINNWKATDRCTAQAQKQFPDYTAEALRKRDLALQQCLAASALPPRAPQAPDPTGPHQ
ncbi:MAG TPA: hypothetical protein VM782_02350, partial [Stellaceae bacterium]|nr:hypothetical protein [Stellaceae bacterium]